MDLSRKITFNTLVQVISRGGVILLSFLTTAILTRNLGRAGYGVFGLINTAVVIFFSLADWGTQMIAVRELSKEPKKTGLLLGNCLWLRSLMAFIGMLIFTFFILVNPFFEKFQKEALLATFIIFFFSLRTSAQIVFHSRLKLYLSSFVELLASFLFLLFLLFFKNNFSLALVFWFLIISTALSSFLALVWVFRMTRVDFRLDLVLVRRLVRESLPMGALMVVFSIYNRIDTFILQSLKGEAATGVYVLAYKVHDNLILGAAYLMNAFFPVIANSSLFSSKKIDLKTVLQKALDLLLAMALPMMILVFVLAPVIIDLLGGEEFLVSVSILRVLVLATGIAYLNHLTGYSLAAIGKQRVHLRFGLLALLVSVGLNLILIPRYSFMGAAWSTVLTELLIFSLTFFYLKKIVRIQFSFVSFPKTVWQLISQKGKIF